MAAAFGDGSVRGTTELCAEHLAHRITHLQHSANPCADRSREGQGFKRAATSHNDLAVTVGEPAFFDSTGRRNLPRIQPQSRALVVPALVNVGGKKSKGLFQ